MEWLRIHSRTSGLLNVPVKWNWREGGKNPVTIQSNNKEKAEHREIQMWERERGREVKKKQRAGGMTRELLGMNKTIKLTLTYCVRICTCHAQMSNAALKARTPKKKIEQRYCRNSAILRRLRSKYNKHWTYLPAQKPAICACSFSGESAMLGV